MAVPDIITLTPAERHVIDELVDARGVDPRAFSYDRHTFDGCLVIRHCVPYKLGLVDRIFARPEPTTKPYQVCWVERGITNVLHGSDTVDDAAGYLVATLEKMKAFRP